MVLLVVLPSIPFRLSEKMGGELEPVVTEVWIVHMELSELLISLHRQYAYLLLFLWEIQESTVWLVYCKTFNWFFYKFLFDSFKKTPHSCGESCGKLRGKNCLHPCDIACHPGPCPPCTLKKAEPIVCYCMRNKREVFCSDPMTAFECG